MRQSWCDPSMGVGTLTEMKRVAPERWPCVERIPVYVTSHHAVRPKLTRDWTHLRRFLATPPALMSYSRFVLQQSVSRNRARRRFDF